MQLRVVWILSIFFSSLINAHSHKTVLIGVDEIPSSLNPYADVKRIPPQFSHLLFDSLFRWNKEGEIESRLVTHWTRLDHERVRFTLRQNVEFHSGNMLSAKDVIWSFKQAEKQHYKYVFNMLYTVEIHDEFNFDIVSKISDNRLLDYLTFLMVLDSDFYQKRGPLLDTVPSIMLPPIKNMVVSGTGPYLLHHYNPVTGMEVIANEEYWDGRVSLGSLRFMRISNPNSRLFALLSGDIALSYGIPYQDINDILINDSQALAKVPYNNTIFMVVNDKVNPVLADIKVRTALSLSINQNGMVKHILNGAGRVDNVFMPAYRDQKSQQNNEIQSAEFDLNAAKKILKDVTLPDKLSLIFIKDESGHTSQVARSIVSMLGKLGIQVIQKEVVSKYAWTEMVPYYDLAISAWKTPLMDRENIYDELFLNGHLAYYLNEKFEQQQIKQDKHLQYRYFEKLQQDKWVIPVFTRDEIWASHSHFNLSDIFSSNGIPYWSALKMEDLNKP